MLFFGCSQRAFERAVQKFEKIKVVAHAKAEAFKEHGKLKKYATIAGMLMHLGELEKTIPTLFAQGAWWQARSQSALFCKGVKQLNGLTRSLSAEIIELLSFALLLILLRTFVLGYYGVPTGSAEPNLLVGDRVWGNKIVYYFQAPRHGEMLMFEDPEFMFEAPGTPAYYWQKYVGFGIPLLGLPSGPQLLTKRVIGVPGDIIEGRIEDNKPVIYRNGKRLHEPYINPHPLVLMYKHTGFFEDRGLWRTVPLPLFLMKKRQAVRYSIDPERPFDDQPFYHISEEDVCHHPVTNEPILFHPDDYVPEDTFGPIAVPEGSYWMMGDSRRNSKDSRFWGFLPGKLVLGRLSFILFSIDGEEAFWLFELLQHPSDFLKYYLRWDRFFKSLTKWNGYDGTHEKKLTTRKNKS